ncbi:MAG: molybdopterin oxidoreductase family protein [Myxococcales bacterium]|nr:MAG: molybdopterin oxidoreductase family protein [Myxococcales bacterium]
MEEHPSNGRTTVHRACTLCEALCGLTFEVEGDRIVSVGPDHDDPISKGYVCPKGMAIAEVHDDPDRIREPLIRREDGTFAPVGWDEALDRAADGLRRVRERHGGDAIAAYIGNPSIHIHGALLLRGALMKALGTNNCFSASTQDTAPRFATSYFLYGNSLVLPVPDIDRTDYLLCLGANPVVSNGSVMSAPNLKSRLREIRARGGKLVVVDPRRTETARIADEHVPIVPGEDALFLFAMIRVLIDRGALDTAEIAAVASGWSDVAGRLARLDVAAAAQCCGVPSATIERLAIEFADASAPTAYSRVGVCNSRHGTLATYATDLLNIICGRLGKVGGAMFPTPAVDLATAAQQLGANGYAGWRSRVRGLPESFGDLPAAVMAEEMETEGAGQIRALLNFAGNPVLTVPNGRRLDRAVANLEFTVAIDVYMNETNRHADVILPAAWALAEEYVDVFFGAMAVRNFARFSPAVVDAAPGVRADWEILLALIERLGGGPTGEVWLDRAMKLFGIRWNPTAMADLMLRFGAHGDRMLPWSKGLSMKKLRAAPHGLDLGPMQPGVAGRVFHKDRKVHLDSPVLMEAFDDLLAAHRSGRDEGGLLLIGRRHLRSNNSWMHNVPSLMTGRDRCQLEIHPDDASAAGLEDGARATLESHVGKLDVTVSVTEDMMPGVVCLPHGYGHEAVADWLRVAGERPGVSVNDVVDDGEVEAVVGQSILNGVAVRVQRVTARLPADLGGGAVADAEPERAGAA